MPEKTDTNKEKKSFWNKLKDTWKYIAVVTIVVFCVGILIGVSLGNIWCAVPSQNVKPDTVTQIDTFYTNKDTVYIPVPSVGEPDTLAPDYTINVEGTGFFYNQEYPLHVVYSDKIDEVWIVGFKVRYDSTTGNDTTEYTHYHDTKVGSFEVTTDMETGGLRYQKDPPIYTKTQFAKFNVITGADYSLKERFGVFVRPMWTFADRLYIAAEGRVYSGLKPDSTMQELSIHRDWYNVGVEVGWMFGKR